MLIEAVEQFGVSRSDQCRPMGKGRAVLGDAPGYERDRLEVLVLAEAQWPEALIIVNRELFGGGYRATVPASSLPLGEAHLVPERR